MKPPPLSPAFVGMLLGFAPLASAQVQLLAWWDFDSAAGNAAAIDSRAGIGAQIRNGAAATAAGGGRTGAGADRAMFFGTGSQNLYVPDASFFNQAATGDAVTVSFWQKLDSITSPFTLFVTSPSSTGGGRGFSGHIPWSNDNIYFDTAGCCDPPQRINDIARDSIGDPVVWVGTWRHVVLVKNGEVKEVYVDGIPGPTGSGAAPLPTDFTDMYIGNGPGLGNVVNGAIDDVAIFSGALDAAQIAALAGGATPGSIVGPNDTDSDGLSDTYENRFFPGDLTKLSSAGDFDADGLTDGTEFSLGTNPTSNDSDGDGLKDGVETRTGTFASVNDTGTSPFVADTDGDGFADGVENPLLPYLNASQPGTDPNKADTDADSFGDGLEVLYSTSNPRNPASRPLRSGLLDILAYWPFNNDGDPLSTSDAIKGFVGELQNGTVFTPDGGGRTGQAGDKAVDFGASGTADTAVRVATGGFLSLGGSQDEIAFSFWQKLAAVVDSSSFWGESPSSGGARGAQGHATWSNNNFYWDTAGCCDPPQRINGASPFGLADTPDWHHIVFQKKAGVKEVWLDGALIVSGSGAAPLPKDFTVLHIGSDAGTANIAGMIDDFAVYADALTPAEIAQLAAGASPTSIVPPSSDTDGDGMDNAYETANGLNPNVDDSLGDLDSDGLANIDEYIKNTKPNNPDTDGDTIKDGAETGTGTFVDLNNRGTNPLSQDSDNDGLADGVENPSLPFVDKNQPGTNPTKSDSAGDTWSDSSEISFGSNPTLPASVPALDPNGLDLLAYWPFDTATDPAKAVDVQHSIEAAVGGGVVYTDAGGGRTGGGSDRAMDYGTAQGGQYVRVLGAQWLNLASSQNQVAISFWQNLSQVISSTVVKFTSPSSSGTLRGLSAHTTWGDGNFYFDSAGCCDGATQRISGPNDVNFVEEWHHIVIQKNGDLKQIWVDGVVKVEGTNTGVLPSDLTDLFIGTSNGGESMLGRLDDFAIFGDALTEAQIAQLAGGASPLSLLGNAPATPLAFTSISFNAATNQVTLTWTSQPGKTYRLESSQTLATWPVEINDNIASGGATTTFVHSLSTFPGGQPATLYYRVKQN